MRGNTVRDIRRNVERSWGIPARAVGYCGNVALDDDDFLPVGAILEFH